MSERATKKISHVTSLEKLTPKKIEIHNKLNHLFSKGYSILSTNGWLQWANPVPQFGALYSPLHQTEVSTVQNKNTEVPMTTWQKIISRDYRI